MQCIQCIKVDKIDIYTYEKLNIYLLSNGYGLELLNYIFHFNIIWWLLRVSGANGMF